MKVTMETIRRAVIAHHGGFDKATDAQIKVLWNSLPKAVQERYLAELKEERSSKNAAGDKSKS